MRPLLALPALLAFALAGCHRDAAPAAGDAASAGEDGTPLPGPAPAGGPVTGMPSRPGPGPVGLPAASSTGTPAAPAEGLPPEPGASPAASATAVDATATTAPAAIPAAPEPTPEDAVAVVRSYYAALAGHDFARAQSLWADGGEPGGHAAAQLASEYGDAAALEATAGAPGRMDAAAGSRYLRVPVAVTLTLRDGSVQRMTGTLTLRRAVVDGATAEQRAWRIASTDLRAAPAP
ncbi:MAG TPA: hypothetical protein VLM17_09910 [Xanthomonadaceae bacterium]|nr:hypothetical protein [Xanthomonadaceae bacterium]